MRALVRDQREARHFPALQLAQDDPPLVVNLDFVERAEALPFVCVSLGAEQSEMGNAPPRSPRGGPSSS